MKRTSVLLLAATSGLLCLFAGCRPITLPNREPFGEETYSATEAQAVYEQVCTDMEEAECSNWYGYLITFRGNTVEHDFYHTEEYSVAWHEGTEDYLWYQERLYSTAGDFISYRDMAWEELQADEYAAHQWKFAQELLAKEPEKLEYKYIPMASGEQYLLTAEYGELEWEEKTRKFPELYFRLDEKKNFYGFTLRWSEGAWSVIDVGYFPYEGSTDLQAERKVWSFAQDLGLIGEAVPDISTQQENREWCQSVIADIDFDSLLERAQYREDLTFPELLSTPDGSSEGPAPFGQQRSEGRSSRKRLLPPFPEASIPFRNR